MAVHEKSILQLLYAFAIWISALNDIVERIQATFLHKTFAVPGCVAYVTLCLKSGQWKSWLRVFEFWIGLYFLAEQDVLLWSLLSDSAYITGLALFKKKVQSFELDLDELDLTTLDQALRTLYVRLLNIEQQVLMGNGDKVCSPLHKVCSPLSSL